MSLSAPPDRIWIVGPSGSGKSTLGRRLSASLDIPHLELDAWMWGPGWARRSEQEFLEAVALLAAGDRWVIDGQYRAAHELLSGRADVVVWLDIRRRVTLLRIARRSMSDLVVRRRLYNGNTQSLKGAVELFRWARLADAEIRAVNTRLQERLEQALPFYRLWSSRDIERFRAEIQNIAASRGERQT